MRNPVNEFMCFYGVGNHGGGPTKENLASIHRLNDDPNYPNVVFSSPEAFFHSVEGKQWLLPIVHSDLQRHAVGCYAAHSGIKRWNRLAENRLVAAEKWSVLADKFAGQPYPVDFERAWKSALFNQFHDILAGTSLEQAYDDARDTFGEAMAIADRNLNYATQAFAWNINIPQEEGMKPIAVFNPHTWPVQANVELEVYRWKEKAVLVDEQNKVIPHQKVQSATTTSRVRLSFMADLPALGYRTYRFLAEGSPVESPRVQATNTVMENEHFRLEFDPETGYIKSLFDKRAQVNVFAGEAAKPVVITDFSDTWGHDVYRYDDVAGYFKASSIQLVEHGAVKSVIRVTSQYERSTLTQDFVMYPNRDQIDVQVTVNWQEQFKLLKLRFPTNVYFMKVTNETAYGHIEQFANGEEVPCQSWVDLSGNSRDRDISYGFSLLNDGKYSMDVNIKDIGLTVLRSPAYAHHIPTEIQPTDHPGFIDQGIQRFTYGMFPHNGSWEEAGTVQRAAELNQKPTALIATYHPNGKLPQADSFIKVTPNNVVVTVLKQAEDNSDLIVRAYETTKTACHAKIDLPKWNRVIEADFKPCEIKTFRVPQDAAQPVIETDMLEYGLS
jgi:alpha-mannosidase